MGDGGLGEGGGDGDGDGDDDDGGESGCALFCCCLR